VKNKILFAHNLAQCPRALPFLDSKNDIKIPDSPKIKVKITVIRKAQEALNYKIS
tara:strand:- start:543 stop:707 length:165 start_codon:yes stop_codon:yes gene_type:complete